LTASPSTQTNGPQPKGGLAADYLQGGLVLAIRWQIFSQFLADLAEHSS